ncbi:MAG: restriction endonuclease subunit S [Patescibacteria group bacterium]|nr:restriction endonuclease subunit S [Patescibacteria group bacterium]
MKQEWKEIELGNKMFFEIIGSGINRFEDSKEYLSTECIKETEIKKTEGEITFNERPSRANMQPKLNSVWFAKMQNTLKVYSFNKNNSFLIDKYILSTGFAGIKVLENIDEDYIRIFFLSPIFNKIKDSNCSGATQKSINNNAISKIKIPLPFSNGKPDLQKQKQIVAILENLERLKEKRKRAILLLDKYLKSVFNEMFFEKGFKEKLLDEVSEIIMGQSPSGSSYNQNGNGIPFFQGKAEFGERFPTVKNWTTEPSKIAESNSVLISVRAPVGSVNVCNIKCCIGRGLASIKPNKETNLEYLYSTLKILENKISEMGTGSTFKAITSKQLRNFKIPLPPIELQEEFASIVENVEKLKEKQKQSLEKIEELFNSSLSKAFVGELI